MPHNAELDRLLVLETAGLRDTLLTIETNSRGIAFVVDVENVLKGVVTDGDIRRAILRGTSLDTQVSDFMTANPVTADVGASPEELLRLMSHRIRHVPIVDERGRVVDYGAFTQNTRLPIATPTFLGNELRYVTECVVTNWISSQGRFVGEFERAFAEFAGAKHGIAVCNGTVALHLALVLAGVGPGDEVIVPTMTFVATASAVRHAGGTPVFVDSDRVTWTLSPPDVARKITAKTKAIIAVHLYGHPADMDALGEIARQHRLFLIEDAAEAHGALFRDRPVGALGDIGCFSFFGNKIVTTGEGGMLTTNDGQLADRARVLRDHGMSRSRKYWHETVGYNYRLTNLQAAIGVAQVEQIDSFLKKRDGIARSYEADLKHDDRIELPRQAPWARRVNWLYTVLLNESLSRDRVLAGLNARGIDSRPTFIPLHTMPPYATGERFPVAETIARRGLSLPSSPKLEKTDIERICRALLGCISAEELAGI